MHMDLDFPMSKRQKIALVIGLLVLGSIGAALFGGAIPGIHPNFSAPVVVTLNGHRYYAEVIPLPLPFFPQNVTPAVNITFHNVTFELQLTDWYSLYGCSLVGHGTEMNGTTYSYVLGGAQAFPEHALTWISPDNEFGLWWLGGLFGKLSAQLFVLVPGS